MIKLVHILKAERDAMTANWKTSEKAYQEADAKLKAWRHHAGVSQ